MAATVRGPSSAHVKAHDAASNVAPMRFTVTSVGHAMLTGMNSTGRSRSAQAVTAQRAALVDMDVLSDPFARGMLSPSTAALLWTAQHVGRKRMTRSVTFAGFAARVLWFDAQVIAALDAGITQVAVIGAGYDSRAWRLRRDGVHFFEVDQPATQQDKVRRAPGPGPIYVEADLTSTDVWEALRAHDLDPGLPALHVVEGVTMYVGVETVSHQLAGLAQASASGSRLAIDFYPGGDGGGTNRHRRQMRLQRMARAGSGETLRFGADRPQAVTLVEASGWRVDEATSLRDAALELVPPNSGLPVGAIDARKTLVAGSRVS